MSRRRGTPHPRSVNDRCGVRQRCLRATRNNESVFQRSVEMSKKGSDVPQYVYEPYQGDGYAAPPPAATSSSTYQYQAGSSTAPPAPPMQNGVAYAYSPAGAPPPPPPPNYSYAYSEALPDGTSRHYYYANRTHSSAQRHYVDPNTDPNQQLARGCLYACCEGMAIGLCAALTFDCCLGLCGLW